METNEQQQIDEKEEKRIREEKKVNLRELLHKSVDDMLDILETLDTDNYIQLHMFSNDFPSQGVILHDIFCEINMKIETEEKKKEKKRIYYTED